MFFSSIAAPERVDATCLVHDIEYSDADCTQPPEPPDRAGGPEDMRPEPYCVGWR